MVLTPEQTKELKEQLKEQVKDLPPGKKEQALEQIEAMSPDALETMLMNQQQGQGGTQKGIFRMIVDGDVPSKKVADNDDAIAVVSKRAVSKGHVIIIPKIAAAEKQNLPKSSLELAKKLGERMKSKLKAKDVQIEPFQGFGEFILNVIPIYEGKTDFSKQYEVSDGEMDEVEKLLWEPKKKKIIKVKKKKAKIRVVKLKRRIP